MDNKLKLRYKLSYGAAGFGESTAYCLISTFLLFYLTTIAGISPAPAGTIVAIGSFWDLISSPVVGYFSDNCSSSMGKRRPFILAGCVPFTLFTMLLFTFVDAAMPFKMAYYTLVIILFWTSYTCYYIPYMALGAELTDDYDQRTTLRTYSTVFNALGAIIGSVTPAILVDYMCSSGMSVHFSWQMTALLIGLVSGITIFLCYLGSRGRDKPIAKEDKVKFSMKDMIRDYIDVLKIRPLQILLAASVISLSGITMANSDKMYFLTYTMGFSAKQISLALLIGCIYGMLLPPVINAATKRFDRKIIFIAFMIIGSLGTLAFRFTGVTGYVSLFLLLFTVSIMNSTYWQLMPAILYDVGEYDKYKNGKDRVGAIMSIQSISEAFAEALGVQVLGIILQIVGFNGSSATQTAYVLGWINNCAMVVPVFFTLVSCIFIWKYPITREVYEKIKSAISEREED